MSGKKNIMFCGDKLNTTGREDQQFQWSRAYKYYNSLPSAEKKKNLIWSSGIALEGCVLEVTDMKEIIQWCTKKIVSKQRIIQMQGHQPISLSPSTFSKMS